MRSPPWLAGPALGLGLLLAACAAPAALPPTTAAGDVAAGDALDAIDPADAATSGGGAGDVAATFDAFAGDGDAPVADVDTDVTPIAAFCADGGWSTRAFVAGPTGTHRHDRAADFTLPLADGTDWNLAEHWLGCESHVFVPDTIPVSDDDATSIWAKDLDALVKKSPKNVHYFFVSRQAAAVAPKNIADMAARVENLVNNLPEEDAAHWHDHLHVVAKRVQELQAWPATVLKGHGAIGFAIDRQQTIRGFGMLADVTRAYSPKDPKQSWPWKSNLAYAAHEALTFNAETARLDSRVGEVALVVPAWQGEKLAQFAETEVTLTTADAIDGYDSLEVDVDMHCPDPDKPEPGNCGAWDYIASLAVRDESGQMIEMARFITSYHRETHWTVDASPMLGYFRAPGPKKLRWEFAPEWNKQPTLTFLALRFVKRGKGLQPKVLQKLWDGGGFNSKYDTLHPDRSVAIAATAKKVELWALITGHGADAGTQCAEFCNHQHVFAIGATSWKKEHKEAGTLNKCMPNMEKGMVPNQGGTWWTGRGGWCPGMQVEPWVADVTDAAKPGSTVKLSYHGLLGNQTPPDGGANIDGAVWLVVYE